MTDQNHKPERFRALNEPVQEFDYVAWRTLLALETISTQLDYLITMMYGQKQEEHHDED